MYRPVHGEFIRQPQPAPEVLTPHSQPSHTLIQLSGLVTAGHASLWPEGGGPAVEIARGDWVTFRRGFLCTWVVHEEIAKRYAYFDAAGAEL